MEAKKPKQKKPAGKACKAGSSPVPKGPCGGLVEDRNSPCGHSACFNGKCMVRYVGPTTHLRDHHIVHAARHASHVWSAAIVAGLAVVLTGAIGYAALGADANGGTLYGEFQQLNQRLDKIENMLAKLLENCQLNAKCGGETAKPSEQDQCIAKCKESNLDNADKANACIREQCQPASTRPGAPDCKTQCEQKYIGMDLTSEQKKSMIDKCVAENCPSASPTYTPPGNVTTGGQTTGTVGAPGGGTPTTAGLAAPAPSECVTKCYNARVQCFKNAGNNYQALRKCVSDETACKQACQAK